MSKWTRQDIIDFVQHHRQELNKSNPDMPLKELVSAILARLNQVGVRLADNFGNIVTAIVEVPNTYNEAGQLQYQPATVQQTTTWRA